MSNLKELKYGVATYRVKFNALNNLKIKVKISKLTSTFSVEESTNALNYTEEFIFSWQQKVFSPNERVKYSKNFPYQNVIETKYFQDVQAMKGIFPTKRLFTYVDHDEYVHQRPIFTTKDQNTLSYVGDMLDKVRIRHNLSDNAWKSGMKCNPVPDNLSDEQVQARHIPQCFGKQMYIMADLGYSINEVVDNEHATPTEPQEVVLCRITVDDSGSISLQPDFSKYNSQYIVENVTNKENFEYSIINVSTATPLSEKEKEIKLLKELYARSSDRVLSLVGSNFDEQPLDNALRLFVTGEIEYAYDFEHQNIYLQYFVDIPDDWIVSHLDQLTGITQLSRGKLTETGYMCYFGFPLEFDMLYQKSIFKSENIDDIPKWPIIYIEVFSVDSWSRYRTEGYGYALIPTTPGKHTLTLSCWRPVSSSITNELRRFFVGGSAELDDLTFTSIPATFDGKYLSKYGFRTASTGNVVLRLNCIQQSKSFIEDKLNKSNSRSLVDRISGTNVHFGVMEVINAFRKARDRLIHIRESDAFSNF